MDASVQLPPGTWRAWLSYQWLLDNFHIHYFIFVLPASHQLLTTPNFPSFSNVFSLFFCHTDFFPLLISSNRKCLLVPLIGHTFKPDHLISLSLPSLYILDSLGAQVGSTPFSTKSPMPLGVILLLAVSKFVSPDQIFLMCSGFRYSTTFLLPPLGYHTGSLKIVLIFPIYTHYPKLFLSQSAMSQKMLTTNLKAAWVRNSPLPIHLQLYLFLPWKLISSVLTLFLFFATTESHLSYSLFPLWLLGIHSLHNSQVDILIHIQSWYTIFVNIKITNLCSV